MSTSDAAATTRDTGLAAQARASAPIFIVGTIRSGSTLLRLILDSHERIAIGPESGFMSSVGRIRHVPELQTRPRWYEEYDLTQGQLDRYIGDMYRTIFGDHAARQGKGRWGEKTPFHVWHLEDMARLFPDAALVGIVRHPLPNIASQRRWRYPLEEATERWGRSTVELIKAGAALGSERFVLCRYEDVVLNPESVLRPLMHFLGEPWSPHLLRHHEIQRAQGSARVVEGGTRTRTPLDPSRVDAWQADYTESEIDYVLERTGRLLRLLGYESGTAVPATATERSLMDGRALDEVLRELTSDDLKPRDSTGGGADDSLEARLRKAEQSLARVRNRRAVRVGDAIRRIQQSRSLRDVGSLVDAFRVRR